MRFLVTGGFGFIGSHVLRQLVAADHDVTCFDIAGSSAVAEPVVDEIEVITGDIRDPVEVFKAVATADPDRIIHLAAMLGRESERAPRDAFEINLSGTITILEAARTYEVERVVAASSAAVYGSVPQDEPTLTETTPTDPETIYGVTKLAVEHVGTWYREHTGVDFAAIRPVHGLGPDRRRGNVEDAFLIRAAVRGEPITVPPIEYPFEIVAVQDEASAFIAVATAESLDHDRYIVGSGEQSTLPELASVVADIVPEASIDVGGARGDDTLLKRPPANPARLTADVDWEPSYSIRETIEAYVEWLEANPNAWDVDPTKSPWETAGFEE